MIIHNLATLWRPLAISLYHAAVLPWPVLIGRPNDVKVEKKKTAHFECQFKSSPHYTLCEWHKGDDVLSVSEKYQFSRMPLSDHAYPDIVQCSLNVLTVSKDDEGYYSCIAYYDEKFGYPVKHKIPSNPGRAELQLTGKAAHPC